MTREQYVRTLENQLAKINQEIDLKIISGQNYYNEAHKHRIIRREVRKHSAKHFFKKLFPVLFQF